MVANSLILALWRQMQVDLYKLRSAWFILGVSNQIGIQRGISPLKKIIKQGRKTLVTDFKWLCVSYSELTPTDWPLKCHGQSLWSRSLPGLKEAETWTAQSIQGFTSPGGGPIEDPTVVLTSISCRSDDLIKPEDRQRWEWLSSTEQTSSKVSFSVSCPLL